MIKLYIALFLVAAANCLSFDGMDFLIYSRTHYKQHLVISGGIIHFNPGKLNEDAFWKFEESRAHPGYYYLHNA